MVSGWLFINAGRTPAFPDGCFMEWGTDDQ